MHGTLRCVEVKGTWPPQVAAGSRCRLPRARRSLHHGGAHHGQAAVNHLRRTQVRPLHSVHVVLANASSVLLLLSLSDVDVGDLLVREFDCVAASSIGWHVRGFLFSVAYGRQFLLRRWRSPLLQQYARYGYPVWIFTNLVLECPCCPCGDLATMT